MKELSSVSNNLSVSMPNYFGNMRPRECDEDSEFFHPLKKNVRFISI